MALHQRVEQGESNALFVIAQNERVLVDTLATNPKRAATKAYRLGVRGECEVWKCTFRKVRGNINDQVVKHYATAT
jgi:hypothetical protein